MEWLVITSISLVFSMFLKCLFDLENLRKGKTTGEKLRIIVTFDKTALILCSMISFTGIAVFASGKVYQHPVMHLLNMSLIGMLLIPIVYQDAKEQIIPNKYILVGLAIRFVTIMFEVLFSNNTQYNSVLTYITGMIFGGGIFLLSSFLLKGSVGMGDVKLFAVIGFFVGFSGMFSVLFYALLASAITGIVLMARKKKSKKDALPMAPFSLVGLLISVLLGI